MKRNEELRLNIRYFLLQLGFWGGAVILYGYKTQILTYKGFSQSRIGFLNAAELVAGALFQIWLGDFADRNAARIPLKNLIGLLSAVTAGLSFAFFAAGDNFWIMLAISTGFGIAFTSISPLVDSLPVLYGKYGCSVNYAKGRTGGSIAWAFLSILAGIYCDRLGVRTLPLTELIFAVLLLTVSLTMPWSRIRQGQRAEKNNSAENSLKESNSAEKSLKKTDHGKFVSEDYDSAIINQVHSVPYILKTYPKYLMFLLGAVLMFMGYNMGSTFLIDVVTDMGGNNTHYGIAQFILAISEVPAAFLLLRYKEKFPLDKMMVVCAVSMTIKTALPLCFKSLPVLFAAQLFEMPGFGIYYAGSVYMISGILPSQDIVKGTTLLSVATVGLGEGIGSAVCGHLRESLGLYGLMWGSVYVHAAAVAIMILMCMINKKGEVDQ